MCAPCNPVRYSGCACACDVPMSRCGQARCAGKRSTAAKGVAKGVHPNALRQRNCRGGTTNPCLAPTELLSCCAGTSQPGDALAPCRFARAHHTGCGVGVPTHAAIPGIVVGLFWLRLPHRTMLCE